MGDFFFKVEVTSHLRVAVEGGVIAEETAAERTGSHGAGLLVPSRGGVAPAVWTAEWTGPFWLAGLC